MDKYYGLKYYDSLITFLFSKTKEELAKDCTNNLIIVEHESKYIFTFIERLMVVTTISFTPEEANEAFGFDVDKAIKRHRRIDEMQLHLFYDYCAEHNMLCYIYDILSGATKIFKEGEMLL